MSFLKQTCIISCAEHALNFFDTLLYFEKKNHKKQLIVSFFLFEVLKLNDIENTQVLDKQKF